MKLACPPEKSSEYKLHGVPATTATRIRQIDKGKSLFVAFLGCDLIIKSREDLSNFSETFVRDRKILSLELFAITSEELQEHWEDQSCFESLILN